jgi:hypothetical protein
MISEHLELFRVLVLTPAFVFIVQYIIVFIVNIYVPVIFTTRSCRLISLLFIIVIMNISNA